MKTLVWDNNQGYSDNEIWFIQLAADEDPDEAVRVLEACTIDRAQTKVVMVADVIQWRCADSIATMDKWLEQFAAKLVDLMGREGEKRDVLRALPLKWRQRIADALLKNDSEYPYHESYDSEAEAIAADLVAE